MHLPGCTTWCKTARPLQHLSVTIDVGWSVYCLRAQPGQAREWQSNRLQAACLVAKQSEFLQAINELVGKADGKDKLLATVQYVLMLVAGGTPGTVKDIQGKVASARKVFRVMKVRSWCALACMQSAAYSLA